MAEEDPPPMSFRYLLRLMACKKCMPGALLFGSARWFENYMLKFICIIAFSNVDHLVCMFI